MLAHAFIPGLLAIAGLAGACTGPDGEPGPTGPPGADGGDARLPLVRTEAVAAGPACAAGGWRIASGLDDDRDGELDDSEVDSVAHVCDGAAGQAGTVVDGSYVIRNSGDVALLDGIETITRDLLITDVGLRAVELPTVRSIGGTLTLAAATDVERLALPALVEIGSLTIAAPNTLSAVHAPALAQAAAIAIDGGDLDLDLSALTSPGRVRISATLADLRGLRGLRTVSGELAIDGLAATPSLAGLEQLSSVGSLVLRGLALQGPGALPALSTVTGTLRVDGSAGDHLAFPALTRAARIEIIGNPLAAISFDALTGVDAIQVTGNPGLSAFLAPVLVGSSVVVVGTRENPALTTVDLRALRAAGTLVISGSPLPALELPALETVAGELGVGLAPALTRLELPALRSVGFLYLLYTAGMTELLLPALIDAGTRFWVYTAPLLCVSELDAIVARMRGHGWSGEVLLYGVDTSC